MSFDDLKRKFGYTIRQYFEDFGFHKDAVGNYVKDKGPYRYVAYPLEQNKGQWNQGVWRAEISNPGHPTQEFIESHDPDELLGFFDAYTKKQETIAEEKVMDNISPARPDKTANQGRAFPMATIQDIESAVMELEELFGGYVGEGNLVDEIRWVIDELKREREKNGVFIPAETAKNLMEDIQQMRTIYADTTRSDWWDADDLAKDVSEKLGRIIENQEDALTVKHEHSHEKGPLNPKGHIVLAHFGNEALIFRGENSPQPYVCAWGYDDKTGEWSHGTYYSDLGRAWDRINPEIIEDASVRWQREDLCAALVDQGIEPSDKVINDFLYEVNHMKGWRDIAIQDGNEFLADKASELGWETHKTKEKDDYSLSSEQRDMTLGKESLEQEKPLHREYPGR